MELRSKALTTQGTLEDVAKDGERRVKANSDQRDLIPGHQPI